MSQLPSLGTRTYIIAYVSVSYDIDMCAIITKRRSSLISSDNYCETYELSEILGVDSYWALAEQFLESRHRITNNNTAKLSHLHIRITSITNIVVIRTR